jgi:hypothetical protein
MGKTRNAFSILVVKPKGKRPLVGRIILKLILKEQGVTMFTVFIWLRMETSGGFLEI